MLLSLSLCCICKSALQHLQHSFNSALSEISQPHLAFLVLHQAQELTAITSSGMHVQSAHWKILELEALADESFYEENWRGTF